MPPLTAMCEMDRFLDAHSVLDRDYEKAAQMKASFTAFVLPGWIPTPLVGDALLSSDSSDASTPRKPLVINAR